MAAGREVFCRRPGIAWREEETAAGEVRAALQEGRDCSGEGTLILVDSGKVFELNLLGAEIWKRCDGKQNLDELVEDLFGLFEVGREELEQDVREFMREMVRRGWVVQE